MEAIPGRDETSVVRSWLTPLLRWRYSEEEELDTLTDEEIVAKLRILKRTYEDVLEGKDMRHWALQNIS